MVYHAFIRYNTTILKENQEKPIEGSYSVLSPNPIE